MFFFTNSIRNIVAHYERLFIERDEDEEERETQIESPMGQYGIIPFILEVVRLTRTPFEDVMKWSICQVFYLTCYSIDKNKMEEMKRKMK